MAHKMSAAEKSAMLWMHGKRVRQPSDRTLDSLIRRGFVYESRNGNLHFTAIGKNVARMIAGEM